MLQNEISFNSFVERMDENVDLSGQSSVSENRLKMHGYVYHGWYMTRTSNVGVWWYTIMHWQEEYHVPLVVHIVLNVLKQDK